MGEWTNFRAGQSQSVLRNSHARGVIGKGGCGPFCGPEGTPALRISSTLDQELKAITDCFLAPSETPKLPFFVTGYGEMVMLTDRRIIFILNDGDKAPVLPAGETKDKTWNALVPDGTRVEVSEKTTSILALNYSAVKMFASTSGHHSCSATRSVDFVTDLPGVGNPNLRGQRRCIKIE